MSGILRSLEEKLDQRMGPVVVELQKVEKLLEEQNKALDMLNHNILILIGKVEKLGK